MCSDTKLLLVFIAFLTVSCSSSKLIRRISSGEVNMEISVPDEKPMEDDKVREITIDSIRSDLSEGPIIMNAIRDSETGEMVATDVINASKVVARFRNVAERSGYVSISFDVTVPSGIMTSRWQLKLRPFMTALDDTYALEPVYITGEGYRREQMKGYQRYKEFMASIVTDTTNLLRIGQLEIFLQRNYPETYAMKNDSSVVPDPVAENLFGVTQAEALRHYTKHLKVYLNERKKSRAGQMFEKHVKDPVVTEGIRLDTVLTSYDGDFIYRYRHTFKSHPSLRKVEVNIVGEIYEDGCCIQSLPFPEALTFYISSLSTLADDTPKYRFMVVERNVYDHTRALIDFEKGSSAIDTALSDNASELRRIIRCIGDVVAHREYELDSLIIRASCSPEGMYAHNSRLAAARSESVRSHLWDKIPEEWKDKVKTAHVPENWEQMKLLIANDTIMSSESRAELLSVIGEVEFPDKVESKLSKKPQYRYLREKIYPQLRSVSFDFHLHRTGMQKDTVHTTELDTIYMSGLKALKNLDYRTAVEKLRPYRDINTALAYMSADYNHSAFDVLCELDDRDAKVCYMKSVVLSRLGAMDESLKYLELCIAYDPYMKYRANLDPELSGLIKKIQPQF